MNCGIEAVLYGASAPARQGRCRDERRDTAALETGHACDAGSVGASRGTGAARLGPMTIDRAAGNRPQGGAHGPSVTRNRCAQERGRASPQATPMLFTRASARYHWMERGVAE